MIPTLGVLLEAGGELTENMLAADLALKLMLSDDDLAEELPSGRNSLFRERLRWALSYLVQTGHVETGGGSVRATSAARVTLAKSAANIAHAFTFSEGARPSLAINAFHDGPGPSYTPPDEETGSSATQEDLVARLLSAHAASMQHLRSEVLSRLIVQTPTFFECVVADLLVALGYGRHRDALLDQLNRRGDGGVDGSIESDELGLDIIYIQAKRYRAGVPVQISDVRDFAGSLEANRATKGVFVTTSRFPASAHEFVRTYPRRIRLIDGTQLVDLMIRTNLGVLVRERLEVKVLDESYFATPRVPSP
jgi:restriction system protein